MTAEVLDVISELRTEGRDFILVTHEMGFARAVSDHVAFMAEGQIIESRPPESLFHEPETQIAKDFLLRILKY